MSTEKREFYIVTRFEEELANEFGKAYCCFTGSGSTAIYLLLNAIDKRSQKVLFPATTCMAPINSAIYAGYEPIFCDVNLDDQTMNVDSLERMLDAYDVGVVVPIHLYGHVADIASITRVAKNKTADIFVLEDCAQYVRCGTADASILSFGHTKIFESGGGGGALLTNDETLYEKVTAEKNNLHTVRDYTEVKVRFENYRKKYYSIKNLPKEEQNQRLLSLQMESKDTFIYNLGEPLQILSILKNKKKIAERRNAKADLYRSHLKHPLISPSPVGKDDVCWRYSFLFLGNRDSFVEKVRKSGIDISTWYEAMYKFYSDQDDALFGNANLIERHVVNLWVDESKTKSEIRKDIDKLVSIAQESL
ncbi:MAG: DegT/DnrJ/EryC1/StrS family aminotransferase [Oscillospiraceae bacterium]|jgi:dTDP-4-amino-4,6-dideoxygalactose transaminase|nr:DegT/DnrJ/EryC1/StrS family aminotransferase [Oscillospiraceae bacterium]